MKRNVSLMLAALLLLVLSHTSSAQDVRTALATLPEADTLIYINPQRILNEAAPRLMSEADLANMRKTFADVQQFSGVDPTKVEFIAMAVRFRKPTADLQFMPPEYMMVAGGDFSAESLVALARVASQGRLRDEKYGAKTMSLMTIDPLVKEAEKNPFLKSFTEVGIVPLNANLIAVGNPNYLRAAVDAADGNGRISSDSLNALLRDPSVLASAAGSPWNSFAKSFALLGTQGNDRAPKWESNLGNFYVALTMDATNFMLRGAMGADNGDTAQIIHRLLSGFLRQGMSHLPEKTGQMVMNSFKLLPDGNEIRLNVDVPHQMVLDMIKSQTQSKKQDAATTAPAKPAKKTTPTRRRRRRG